MFKLMFRRRLKKLIKEWEEEDKKRLERWKAETYEQFLARINNLNKGRWVNFPEDKEVKFFIKPLPLGDALDFKARTAFIMSLLQKCVVDWKGLIDEETNKPLKCNKTNKEIVFTYCVDITSFLLQECCYDLNLIIRKKFDDF